MISYVAAPYSDPNPEVVNARIQAFCQGMADLIEQGGHPVSPLSHHLLTDKVKVNFPLTWEYWREYSEKLLAVCDELVVFQIDGWDVSTGVRGEIEIAEKLNIPIRYVTPTATKSISAEYAERTATANAIIGKTRRDLAHIGSEVIHLARKVVWFRDSRKQFGTDNLRLENYYFSDGADADRKLIPNHEPTVVVNYSWGNAGDYDTVEFPQRYFDIDLSDVEYEINAIQAKIEEDRLTKVRDEELEKLKAFRVIRSAEVPHIRYEG